MKLLKKIAVVFLVVLMVIACVGCTALVQLFENREMRANTEIMLDAILADDFDTAYAVVDDICTEETFISVYDEINKMLSDVESYELSILSANQNTTTNSGKTVSTATASYKMKTNADTYIVDVKIISPQKDLCAFYVTPYEKTDHYGVGTIDNMKNASVFQWIMLMSNIIIIGISVFAFIDCCRQKIRPKVLWLIIIIAGFTTIGATIGTSSVYLNFNIGWLFTYSAYITYGGGTNVFRLMLPVGAIIYLALRKKMIIKAYAREKAAIAHKMVQTDDEQKHISDKSINQ